MDILAIRIGLGLRPSELARRLGISPGHMADLESGRRQLSLPLAAKLQLETGDPKLVDRWVAERIGGQVSEPAE
jgi:transcriptional regulator with XRE-family HTH domain